MTKQLYLLTIACVLSIVSASASVGDTTWVYANHDSLNYYNNFDSTVTFPSGAKSYRKIYMIFTLGQYDCPTGTQYCHQWDYTVQNYLMTPSGDTFELGRFITPFATSGTPGFGTNWHQHYIFDVTDYYLSLRNTATIRIHYSGYSGGFTADVKFAFIEGTPERNVLRIDRAWDGSHSYGNTADPIDNLLVPMTYTAPTGTQSAELKLLATGHGADSLHNCCEFDTHGYDVVVNGSKVNHHSLYRDDCGSNELYPQGGTWIDNRSNWCPGDMVNLIQTKLTGVHAGTNYTLGLNFDPYTGLRRVGSDWGSYTINGVVSYYGAMNHSLDASLVDIISPTTFEWYRRENPSVVPKVKVHNAGSTAILSLKILYGERDSARTAYTWSGHLNPLADTIITLPPPASVLNLSIAGQSGIYSFVAQIAQVNGTSDEDASNDKLTSNFLVAPNWPPAFIISMKTNNAGVSSIGVNPSEDSWQIEDSKGNIVAHRSNADVNHTYNDTLLLNTEGYYKLTVTDQGCDGLHWWPYDNPPVKITAGTFTAVDYQGGNTAIPLDGNYYVSQSARYHDDFGCGFVQYFTVAGTFPVSGLPTLNLSKNLIEVYPNPAADRLTVRITADQVATLHLAMTDIVGHTVYEQQVQHTAGTQLLPISTVGLAAGMYMVRVVDGSNNYSQRIAIER